MGLFSRNTPQASCDCCGMQVPAAKIVRVSASGRSLYSVCGSCNARFLERVGGLKTVYPLTLKEFQSVMSGRNREYMSREHRIRCSVCGEVFCYSFNDLVRNVQNLKASQRENVGALLSVFSGSLVNAQLDNAAADRYESKIVDYSHCPKCHSSDLKEISENEYLAIMASKAPAAVSSADELKKFRELLDSGIITQEEFDAKKKQLLGL